MSDIETVRKRPGMYVGPTDDGTGLHNLVFEVVSNAVKEGLAGYCSQIELRLEPDGSVIVRDDGRGLPAERDARYGLPQVEVALSRLHYVASDVELERIPESLRGSGLCVVNALSDWLNLRLWRDGLAHSLAFRHGKPLAPLTVTGGSNGKRGTEIAFMPDYRIFTEVGLSFVALKNRFRTLGSLSAGVTLTLVDARGGHSAIATLQLVAGGVPPAPMLPTPCSIHKLTVERNAFCVYNLPCAIPPQRSSRRGVRRGKIQR